MLILANIARVPGDTHRTADQAFVTITEPIHVLLSDKLTIGSACTQHWEDDSDIDQIPG